MNITLEIKLTASPELLEAIKVIAMGISAQPIALAPIAAESAASSRTRKPAADKSASKEESQEQIKASEQSSEIASSESVSEQAEKTEVTVETVRAAVQVKAQSGKRDQVKSLLTKFEVARVTDLPETKYAKFLEEVNAL